MTDWTLPKLLMDKARTRGKEVALREKEFGIWQQYTWEQYWQNVKSFSYGLLELGFKRGDRLAIIGDNRPEWLFGALAAQGLGGISVGIYQDSLAKEISYYLNHSEVRIVLVEDQEQVDKLLEIQDEIPNVEAIIYYDPKGLRNYTTERLLSFEAVQKLGETYQQRPDAREEKQLVDARGGVL